MKDLHRERRLDPAKSEFPRPLAEDCTNYLLEPPCLLSPGVHYVFHQVAKPRVQFMKIYPKRPHLRNSRTGQDVVTVANHGFLYSTEVYHPTEEDGVRIREIVDRRPEYDNAFMKLTPSEFHEFTNSHYFSAETPTRLAVRSTPYSVDFTVPLPYIHIKTLFPFFIRPFCSLRPMFKKPPLSIHALSH